MPVQTAEEGRPVPAANQTEGNGGAEPSVHQVDKKYEGVSQGRGNSQGKEDSYCLPVRHLGWPMSTGLFNVKLFISHELHCLKQCLQGSCFF